MAASEGMDAPAPPRVAGCYAPAPNHRGPGSMGPPPEVVMSVEMRWAAVFCLCWPLMACGGAARSRSGAPPAEPALVRADGGRLLARSARIQLEVEDEEDFAPTLKRLAALATELKGYVVEQRSWRVVFKVPAAQLDRALERVAALGEVVELQVTAMDLTTQHTDLKARIENLKRLRSRLRELVGQATEVATILKVEKELARVTGELERLEAQMRALSNRVTMARIRVTLEEAVSPGPVGWIFYGLYRGVKWLFVWD